MMMPRALFKGLNFTALRVAKHGRIDECRVILGSSQLASTYVGKDNPLTFFTCGIRHLSIHSGIEGLARPATEQWMDLVTCN